MGFWSSLQREQFLYKYVNNNAECCLLVSLSADNYLFLSLEWSQIWKHYLIILVKFCCFLRPSPVALPSGIKKIKAVAHGHTLTWVSSLPYLNSANLSSLLPWASCTQAAPALTFARSAGSGSLGMQLLLWQWCHPIRLLIPSAAATAKGYGGVAVPWLVLAISWRCVSLGQCEPAPGTSRSPAASGVGKHKGGLEPPLFASPCLALRTVHSRGRIWARVSEMQCYRNLPSAKHCSCLNALCWRWQRCCPRSWLCLWEHQAITVSVITRLPPLLALHLCHCFSHRLMP